MARKGFKEQRTSLVLQKMKINQLYGNVESCCIVRSSLCCILNITPSETSEIYKVKITYQLGRKPSAVLLSPELKFHNNKRPHHLYLNDKDGHPTLCVFYPGFKEWTPKMFLADTFIPWISTWLNAYEYWQITGTWYYPEAPSHSNKALASDKV